MGDADRFLKVLKHSFGVHDQSIIVTESKAGGVEVGAEDGDLHATHDRELVCLFYKPSLPLVEGVLLKKLPRKRR